MATVTLPRSVRKPYVATKPATGTVRWAVQPTTGPNAHPGCLVVTTADSRTGKPVVTSYLVHPVHDNGRLVGWRLQRSPSKVYDLSADLSSCDCPDATFHPERPEGGCKHRKALAAALKALAL